MDHDQTAAAAPETPEAEATGRLVLLTTTHRVAPGLLSWQAWQTLRGADEVVCPDEHHPQLPYLLAAGVTVEHAAPGGRDLVDRAAGGRTVVYVVPGGETDSAVTDELARLAGSGRVAMPELELLPGSYDLPGARLLDLVQVMDRIRRECPWSSARTSEELAKYGVEEVYELLEAIEEGDREALREELGDVLLQVVFHARIAEEHPEEPFSIDDVAGTIVDKLIHRHPHIYGDVVAETPEEVRANWIRLKGVEKGRRSVTEGIPLGQPALALAAKLVTRAGQLPDGVDAVPLPAGDDHGARLLALAAEAVSDGVDPEAALREAARRYRDAVRAAEGVPSD